jgi:hypothetical protein
LTNHKILFFTDNAAVVDIINNTTSKDKVIMKLVRRLVLAALKYNIFFRAKHIRFIMTLSLDVVLFMMSTTAALSVKNNILWFVKTFPQISTARTIGKSSLIVI